MGARSRPRVEVRRSDKRRRTVSAYRDGAKIIVLVPDNLTGDEERAWVSRMVARIERKELRAAPRKWDDADLMARAQALSDAYLGGLAVPESVRWVGNQRARWGSCTPRDRTIRLSERLQRMPEWVVDYVIVHELAHLIEPQHDEKFWGWVAHYPATEKAKGYLAGWSDAARMPRPPSHEVYPAGDAVD